MNSLKINTMHTNVVKMEVSKMMKEMKLVDSAEKKITTNKKDWTFFSINMQDLSYSKKIRLSKFF